MEIDNPVRVFSFWTKVIVGDKDECWIWTGAKDRKGYGNFTVAKGKTSKAHRFSFLLHYGWILPTPYWQVDHDECNNPSCVNPYHLLCISHILNNEKSSSPSAVNKRKTHCKYGHEFSDENTIQSNGRRICIACEVERGRIAA